MASPNSLIAPTSNADTTRQGAVGRWVALAAVVVLASVLRLYALDLIDVRYDEASGARFGLRVAGGEGFSALPNTGSVANHPPVYAYLMAVPYLITRDFIAVAAYRALIDVLAVAVCFWLCARHFSTRVAWFAALFFAVAPWSVMFSRNLGVLPAPLFSALLLFGLLEVTRWRNPWGWAVAGWGLALTLGSHWSAIYLVPVVAIAVVTCFRSLRWLPVLIGLVPCVLIGGAYVLHDAPGGFGNLRGLLGAAGGDAVFSLDALWRALWMSGGMHLSDLAGPALDRWREMVPSALEIIDLLQVALLGAGVVWLAVRAVRVVRAPRRVDVTTTPSSANDSSPNVTTADWTWLVLLLWWAMPVVFQLRHTQHVQMHYLLPQYPAPFIIMGLVVDAIMSRLSRVSSRRMRVVARAAGGAALALIVCWQVFSYLQLLALVASSDTSAGGYGLPARNGLAVARRASEAVCASDPCSGPRDVIVVTPGGDPAVNEQAAVWDVFLAGVPHRFANSDAGLILRLDSAQYVFAPGSDGAYGRLAQLVDLPVAASDLITLPIRAGSNLAYTALRLDAGAATADTASSQARWDNGVSLLAHRAALSADGATLRVDLFLRIERPAPAGTDYHWYNHLLAGGQKIAQLDGGGIHPANWRAGDVLWHWFDLALPDPFPQGEVSLRIGSYLYPQIQNVPLALPNGTISDGIELPINIQP